MKSLITLNIAISNVFPVSNSKNSKICQLHQTRRLEFYINHISKSIAYYCHQFAELKDQNSSDEKQRFANIRRKYKTYPLPRWKRKKSVADSPKLRGGCGKVRKKPSKVELSHDQGESFEGALDGWTKHPFPSFKPMIFREIGIQNTFRLHFL